MEPKNKLDNLLEGAMYNGGMEVHDAIAIAVAVHWIATHDCPDDLGTYWHKICQELVKPL